MSFSETIEALENQLVEDLERGLLQITEAIKPGSDMQKEFKNQKGRFNELNKDYKAGGVRYDVKSVESTKIRSACLDLLADLKEDDLREDLGKLIIYLNVKKSEAPPKGKRHKLEHYFEAYGIKGVNILAQDTYEPPEYFHIMIFDNRSVRGKPSKMNPNKRIYEEEKDVARMQLMEKYLMEEATSEFVPPYFLHFGENNPLVEQYREKAYAANSIFSLFARLNEMRVFIEKVREIKLEENDPK